MAENKPNLCSVCAAINFEQLFYPGLVSEADKPLPDPCLGTLSEILERAQNCDVCKLIIDAHRHRYKRAPYGCTVNHPDFYAASGGHKPEIHPEVKKHGLQLNNPKLKQPIKCSLSPQTFSWRVTKTLDFDDSLASGTRNLNRVAIKLEPCPWLAILVNSICLQAFWPNGIDSENSKDEKDCVTIEGTGRKVGSLLDLSLVQRWLHQCEEHHGDKCHKPDWLSDSENEWPERCRVIDVKNRRIVDLLPTMRYVALSYVWGSSEEARRLRFQRRLTRENLCQLQEENGLDAVSLPQTIKDAMQVTEGVGENFLWVDALCIAQDDPEELGHQTARMDQIYSKAVFTILAACGEDADSGLAGLPNTPRDIFQRQIQVSPNGLHITPCVTMIEEDTLQYSSWGTRGWTFQERLLSRRSLIFTNTQVYWCCDSTTWEEESLLDLPGSTASVNSHSFGCYDEWDDNYAKFSTDRIDMYITQFSERKFTFPSDVLPAFLGIIRRFEHLNNEKLHWGVNVSTFDQALTWNFGHTRRREMYTYITEDSVVRKVPYPSWSWLGWKGFIGATSGLWIKKDYEGMGMGEMMSLLKFYSLRSDGSVDMIKGNSLIQKSESLKEDIVEPTEQAKKNNEHKWMGETTVTGPIDLAHASLASDLESLQITEDQENSQQDLAPYDTGRIVFWTSHATISVQVEDGVHMETSEGLVKLDLRFAGEFTQANYYVDLDQDSSGAEGDEKGSKEDSGVYRGMGGLSRHTVNLIVISRCYRNFSEGDKEVKLNVMAVEEKVPGSGVWSRFGIGVMTEEEWAKLDLDWRMVVLE
ncbi:hypothetical protein F53441_67 [Fusarium austroafricanum]|uniref:Heterokaryon incompatibility domain-containing protein n=1 Tax=Fusarium austroafricanum TaxID=2364996 RepID=A0A8H4PF19_9HYPO|nr:hypothetical protein F53441_67 [Fusarium austroafricanum]